MAAPALTTTQVASVLLAKTLTSISNRFADAAAEGFRRNCPSSACNARSGFHLDSTPYKILSVAASMAKVLQLFVLPVSGSHRSAGRDQTFWSACSLLWLSLVGSGYLVGGLLRPSYQLVEDQ